MRVGRGIPTRTENVRWGRRGRHAPVCRRTACSAIDALGASRRPLRGRYVAERRTAL